jgi:hypothetical protein
MVSSDVASESHEGSLVFLKSCIRVLNDLNLHQFQSLHFLVLGWGLVYLHVVMVGLGFLQVQAPCYLNMLHLNRGKLNFFFFYNLKKYEIQKQ